MKRILTTLETSVALLFIVFLLTMSLASSAYAQPRSAEQAEQSICTLSGVGTDGDLFHSVRGFIGMLGKPLCFQFLRWHYKDALVDVPKFQTVLAVNVEKVLVPGSPGWSNSTRLARCRAFYPDSFIFQGQQGNVRSYTSPDGPFTTELGINSCFIRAVVAPVG
jgi:hypothetical protein